MRTVHKYALNDTVNQVSTFEGCNLIHVANQREQITVWAEVNTLARERMMVLYVVGTGGEVPRFSHHVGSVLMANDSLVFHVYVANQ